jgi:hypothetical protein
MRTFLSVTTILASALLAGSALGADAVGAWACTAKGETTLTGMLTLTASNYWFTHAGTSAPTSGTYTIDQNIIHVTGGVLRDELKINVGYLNGAARVLAFNMGVGKGLTCVPA